MTTIDFTVNPEDTSLKALYRIRRLASKHCFSGGRQIKNDKCNAVIAILDNLIKTDHKKYDAINRSGEYWRKCNTADKYADGKWMVKTKLDLSFSRNFASKHNKQTSIKGVTIYPGKG